MQQLYRFLVYSNLLISLAAVAQCLLTYLILDRSPHVAILAIEFASTLLLYNVSLYLSKPKNPETSPFERTRWFFQHIWLFWLTSSIAFFGLLFSLFYVHWTTVAFLGGVGLVSLAYGFPLFGFRGRKVGLRQIPGLKVFHIAVIWSLSGVGLPVVEMWANGDSIDWYVANYLGVIKIVFLLICTLPFDIRDMKQDALYGLKTLPNMLGEFRAKQMCYLLLGLHAILVIFAPYVLMIKIGLLLTNFFVLLIYGKLFRATVSSYESVYLLDAVLVLQYVVVAVIIQIY